MRSCKSFVKIIMHNIEPDLSRFHDPEKCIEICSIHIHQSIDRMNDFSDFFHLSFENTESIGIRQHKSGNIIVDMSFQIFDIDHPFFIGSDLDHFITGKGDARRICPMCRIRKNDLFLVRISVRFVVSRHHFQTCKFTVCSGNGLQSYFRKTGNISQSFL